MVFTIYRHGGHLEFGIKTILAIFLFSSAWMLHMKFVTFGLVVSEEKSFESVDGRRTDDGGPYPISSPGAFGSGGLKNWKSFLYK